MSWQGLILKEIVKNTEEISKENKFGLNLVYFYEKFIAKSSKWDRCDFGGEMCKLYKNLPKISEYKWGDYKTDKKTALKFLEKVKDKFPTSCFIWMGDKDQNNELYNNNNESKRISSLIYLEIKENIKKSK
jgi:hypothetical protein